MRILVLDQFSDWGGAQLCLRDVLLEVRRRGWEAEVMAPAGGPLLSFARDCGFDTQPLRIGRYSNGRKSPADVARYGFDMTRTGYALRSALRARPADLVYVNGPRVLPALAGVGSPVVFHAHSLLPRKYARAIARWSLRRTRAAVIACSEFSARPLREALGKKPVRVIYNGVEDQGFRVRRSGNAPVRVGILGRIAAEKGHHDFLRAAQLLARESEAVGFVVIGAALFSDPEYARNIHSVGTGAGVEFRGWTDDVARTLHDLDILAVPSASQEASPRVVMEALSAGTCVVAYPSGGIPELIRGGHSGMLTDACTPEALARAIQFLVRKPELRAALAENGRTDWETRFTLGRFQREVCDQLRAAAVS